MPITRFTFPMGRFIPIPFSLSCSFPSSIYILLSTFIFMFQVLFHFHILFHFYLQCSLSYSCLCSCLCSFSFPVFFFMFALTFHCHVHSHFHVVSHSRAHFHFRIKSAWNPIQSESPAILDTSSHDATKPHEVGMESHTKWIAGHTGHNIAWGRHEIPYTVNHRPYWARGRMRSAWHPIQSESPAIFATKPHEVGMKSHAAKWITGHTGYEATWGRHEMPYKNESPAILVTKPHAVVMKSRTEWITGHAGTRPERGRHEFPYKVIGPAILGTKPHEVGMKCHTKMNHQPY